jgi:hypothetical protein
LTGNLQVLKTKFPKIVAVFPAHLYLFSGEKNELVQSCKLRARLIRYVDEEAAAAAVTADGHGAAAPGSCQKRQLQIQNRR